VDHVEIVRADRNRGRRDQSFAVPVDDGEQVVEIVGDAAGELTDGFELLRLPQPRLQISPRLARWRLARSAAS